jgi:hypothetical protein
VVVPRIPDFQADKHRAAGQDGLFDVWRFHAFFTATDPTVLGTVAADQVHHRHAIIEQVHADLKNSALAHLPRSVHRERCLAGARGDRVQPHPPPPPSPPQLRRRIWFRPPQRPCDVG